MCFILDSCHNCSPSQQICDNLQLLTLNRVEGLAKWLSAAVRLPGNDTQGPFYSSRALESCSGEKENASILQALLPQLPEAYNTSCPHCVGATLRQVGGGCASGEIVSAY